jgi:ABC-2 type transport system permease protein
MTAFASFGVSRFRPYNTRVLPHPRDRWRDEGEWVNPLFLALGPFDLAYLIVLVLPLGIILFLHDIVAADREQSTATLLAVQGGTLQRVAAMRLAIRVAATVVFVTVMVVAAWVPGSGGLSSRTHWLSLGALLAVTLAYTAFWMGLTAVVGLKRIGTTAALMMLGAIWATTCLALPVVVDWVVAQRHPLPTSIERFAIMANAMHDAREREAALIDAYVRQHPDTARVLKDESTLLITPTNLLVAKEVEDMLGGSLRELSAIEERRRRLLRRLAPVAPPLLAYLTLARIAGTDSGRYDRFEAALQQYHANLQELFEPHLMRRNRLSAPLQIPKFAFPENHRAEIVAASLTTCGFLFAVGALLSGWALRRIRI